MIHNSSTSRIITVMLVCTTMAMGYAQVPSDTTSSSVEKKVIDTQKVMKNPKSLVEDFMKMESSF